jgi:hypothetical protein
LEIKEKIAAHFRTSGGKMLCDQCIATAIGLLHSGLISEQVTSLLQQNGLQRGIGTCAACKKATIVTKAI